MGANSTLAFIRRVEYFDSDPDVKNLLDRVLDYRELLSCVRQTDYKISEGSTRKFTTILLILWSLLKLLIIGILMLPGIILSLPSLIVVSVYSRRYQKNALKKSSVKIRAVDVVATGKIVSSSLCFVISLIVEPMVILALCARRGAHVTFLDYVALITIFPWLFYLTMYLGGRIWREILIGRCVILWSFRTALLSMEVFLSNSRSVHHSTARKLENRFECND